MVIAIDGLGTPEAVWQAWPALRRMSPLALDPLPARAVVVAPHPDDEVLGVGGLLTMLATAGVPLLVVAVSDGEASHPHSGTVGPSDMARRRRIEQRRALDHLGLAKTPIQRCRLPDGRLAEHEPALAEILRRLLEPGDWCLTTWERDGHPDHEAVARAAGAAAEYRGARLLSFPIWAWHWSHPDDPRVPWASARQVRLPDPVIDAKRRAVDAFASQVQPLSSLPGDAAILGPHALARLTRTFEVILA